MKLRPKPPLKQKSLAVIGCDTDMIFPSDDDILRFDWRMDYGALLVKAGVFGSVRQAWQAGYRDQIPAGWNDNEINGFHVLLYNPLEVRWALQDKDTENSDDDEDDFDPPWADELAVHRGRGWQGGS